MLSLQDLGSAILRSIPGGVLVTDAEGRIIYCNEWYCEVLEVDYNEVVGKLALDVVPGTRMHIVGKTGKAELGTFFKLKNGESVLINRIPIRMNGEIVGVIAYSSFSDNDTLSTTATVEQISKWNREINQYKKELKYLRGAKYSIEQIIGESAALADMKELITRAAQTKSTVLIYGETGTGKELVAHAIHQQSKRNYQPFVRLNCAAIPGDLLESELFGYEEGAFTGARRGGKIGKFELANGGTLLLDEINQMPLYLQSKLLRVIQEREVERVGGNKSIDLDVRLIFTSNENLTDKVKRGEFRKDLFYRINVVSIEIPPLRARTGDIPSLVGHFVGKINRDLGLNITGVNRAVVELFQTYHWPGNIRELENLMERAANIALKGELGLKQFENLVLRIKNETSVNGETSEIGCLASTKAQAEREAITQALEQTRGNITAAAKLLKIHRSVLYDKIHKYGIRM